jgi:mannose-6-phosphate isomerase class I
VSATGGSKAVLAALGANLGIAVIKFGAFAITGSSSMLAEGVHSVVDSGNQGLLLAGGRSSRKLASPEHPFGYGRDRYVFAFLVSLMLFSAGGLFAVYEGIGKIRHPHHVESPVVALVVLVVAVGLESFSLRTAVHESRPHKGEDNWVQFIRHAKVPELPLVLLEDVAALIGLVLALLGVGLAALAHQAVWDGIGTLGIGALLITVAVILVIETKSLLVGEAAAPEQVRAIAAALLGGGVESIIHLRTMHLGPEELLVGAKISMPADTSFTDVAGAIDAAEARVRRAVPSARVIYLEPDVERRAAAAPAGPGVGLPAVVALDGVIRHYAWGSRTAIPELLGIEPDGEPAAELWLGAHPDDPSAVSGHDTTLDALLAGDPEGLLGAAAVARFGPRLPFLLKVLAIDTALSIQVHPSVEQARAGFAAEDAAGLPRDAPGRNYRDRNHKPEMVCALTPFEALCGFRPIEDTLRLLDAWDVAELAPVRDLLAGPDGLRAAFTALLGLTDPVPVVAAVAARAATLATQQEWAGPARAVRLAAGDFPGDVGAVVALLLNYVRLEPGEAIYLGAGTVHCYLRGTGVEVMANSDNVLRCGLTPKHVDLAEVLKVADFTALPEPRWPGQDAGPARRFATPAPDFALSVLDLAAGPQSFPIEDRGPRLVLCTSGRATVVAAGASVALSPGRAAFVAAGADPGTIHGAGRVFVASVGAS